MPTAIAKDDPYKRYERWYPLLQAELQLARKPSTPVIAIGNIVHHFLGDKMMPNVAGYIIHYSRRSEKVA
jgi:hypothetical protein